MAHPDGIGVIAMTAAFLPFSSGLGIRPVNGCYFFAACDSECR
jgi:hypothetical protein